MVVCCVQQYSTHFIKKLGKSLELFFHKVHKTVKKGKKGQKWQKRAKRAKKGDFSKISNMYQKKGHAIFEPLRCPNFIPSFKKILRAFFQKSCYAQTDRWTHGCTDKTDSIGPSGF